MIEPDGSLDEINKLTEQIIGCTIEVHRDLATGLLESTALERFDPVFEAQVLTYFKITEKKVGLLNNFNTRLLTSGIKRYIL